MAETQAAITENSDTETERTVQRLVTSQLAGLGLRLDELQQQLERVEKMTGEIHGELEAAKPMIERWQHSKIRKLAAGQMPWDHA